ncbi:hypothetical protein CDAR_460341 [Caerostris darwini]|uniref:Secreted protein n=1 Tax=Caerostris darwini TaxID=1538125 RepID=A0AAV4PQ63_9ARAC|nr:hypothetical protein CDAR_460341 [Caerostris darwini]
MHLRRVGVLGGVLPVLYCHQGPTFNHQCGGANGWRNCAGRGKWAFFGRVPAFFESSSPGSNGLSGSQVIAYKRSAFAQRHFISAQHFEATASLVLVDRLRVAWWHSFREKSRLFFRRDLTVTVSCVVCVRNSLFVALEKIAVEKTRKDYYNLSVPVVCKFVENKKIIYFLALKVSKDLLPFRIVIELDYVIRLGIDGVL